MRMPLIGLSPLIDTEKESYWMLPGYMEGIRLAGGIPVMLPLTTDEATLEQLAVRLDALLLTGGHDIFPGLYGQTPIPACGAPCAQRDEMETALFRLLFALDKPVLGICRGLQLINAVMGGTLYQDLPTQHPSAVEHHQKPPYDVGIHQVTLVQNSPLHALLGQEQLTVNSYHHQAIKTLAPGLQAMAVSEDGLVEAIYLPDKPFVWAVQWHPEFSLHSNSSSRKIFARFLKAALK